MARTKTTGQDRDDGGRRPTSRRGSQQKIRDGWLHPQKKMVKCGCCGVLMDKKIIKKHEAQCRVMNFTIQQNKMVTESLLGQPLERDIGWAEHNGFQGCEDSNQTRPVLPEPVKDPKKVIVQFSTMETQWLALDDSDNEEDDVNNNYEDEEESRNSNDREEGDDDDADEHNQDIVRPDDDEDDASFGAVIRGSEVAVQSTPEDVLTTFAEWERNEEIANEFPDLSNQGYTLEKKWCSTRRPNPELLHPKSPLRKILMDKEVSRILGLCFQVDDPDTCISLLLEDREVSMVRLMDYCEMKKHSRGFIDGLLDLLVEEMDKGFDPRDRPLRETVSKKVMKKFGGGCAPTVYHVPVADEDKILSALDDATVPSADKKNKKKSARLVDKSEEELEECDQYKSIPQKINSRERYMVDVIVFNTRNMILDLLGDTSIFGDLDNLVVNKDNPFMPYRNTSQISDELLDGTWWTDTLARLKLHAMDPFIDEVEFILPIIFYVDKTGYTLNQRFSLEPFIMTTAIIRKFLRNHPKAWRPVGFIPDLESKSSAEKSYINSRNKGATAQAYHMALECILEGMQKVQDEGIVTWLRLGNHVKKVRIRPEVACIINDGKSADMTTLRVPSFHPKRRVSRSCTTLQENSDLPTHNCEFVQINTEIGELFRVVGMAEKEIREDPKYMENNQKPSPARVKSIIQEAKDNLNEKSFHPVRNAFLARCIRFGLDPRNIWGANPIDLMHAFQSGLLMYLVKMILENVPPSKQVQLDRLVHKLFKLLRSNVRDTYPRLNFSKGFSKLTMLTSDEWAGKLFVILTILHTEEGRQIFSSAKTFSEDDKNIPLPTTWNDPEFLSKNIGVLESLANQLDAEHHEEVRKIFATIPKDEAEDKEQQEKVRKVLQKKKVNHDDPEEMIRKCSVTDFTELAEALLCFHAWYKMGVNRMKDGKINTSVIRDSVARMLAMVRYYCPRKKGNGWKLQKFHDILHLAMDMERFGHPTNYDAGPMESGLKYWAKLPASTSQTRGYSTFVKQVAMRTFEFQCISKALRMHGHRSIVDPKKISKKTKDDQMDSDSNEPVLCGTRYHVYKSKSPHQGVTEQGAVPPPATSTVAIKPKEKQRARNENEQQKMPPASTTTFPISTAINRKKGSGAFVVSPVIENFLRFQPQDDEDKLPCTEKNGAMFWELRTELSFCLEDTDERINIRCHPNFGNEGPWYDWIIVHFEGNDDNEDDGGQYARTMVPCKVLAVAQNPEKKDDIRILVHGCKFREKDERKPDTVLLEKWELAYHDLYDFLPTKKRTGGIPYRAPLLSWISPENVVDRCLVIEEEPGIFETCPETSNNRPKNKVLLVRKRQMWPAEFTDQ